MVARFRDEDQLGRADAVLAVGYWLLATSCWQTGLAECEVLLFEMLLAFTWHLLPLTQDQLK